jgi:thioredoxin 2
MAAPEVAKVAANLAGRAVVLKVNTEEHPQLAARYRIQGIPNFIVFRAGEPVKQHAGLVRYDQMQRWLTSA